MEYKRADIPIALTLPPGPFAFLTATGSEVTLGKISETTNEMSNPGIP